MRDKHQLMASQALIDYIEREETVTFWGQECVIKPAMVPTVLGDGGKLAYITPMATRPNHYAILVHSTWTEDDLGENSELKIRTIEECYGNSEDQRDEEDGAEDENHPWPAWHDGGHSWCMATDVPKHVMQAAQADLARQMHEQRAFFMGVVRIKPGVLLKPPEFGLVQARLNDELGWHYCRRGVRHEFSAGDVGYATDFTGVEVSMKAVEDGPDYDLTGIHRRMSTPTDPVNQPAAQPTKRPRPR